MIISEKQIVQLLDYARKLKSLLALLNSSKQFYDRENTLAIEEIEAFLTQIKEQQSDELKAIG